MTLRATGHGADFRSDDRNGHWAIPRPIGTAKAGLESEPFSFLPTAKPASGSPTRTGTPTSRSSSAASPVETRGSAGEHELPDPQRFRLTLVELERGDEVAPERLEGDLQRLARPHRLLRAYSLRHRVTLEAELDSSRARRRQGLELEGAGDRVGEGVAAPVEHAGVLAAVAVGDAEDAPLRADGDRDERAPPEPLRLRGEGGSQRTQEREGLQVDADQAMPPSRQASA